MFHLDIAPDLRKAMRPKKFNLFEEAIARTICIAWPHANNIRVRVVIDGRRVPVVKVERA
jgi:hypothetical protein